MLLLYMISGLIIWLWQPVDKLLPNGDYFSLSQHSFYSCHSLCRIEDLWTSSIYMEMSTVIISVQLMYRQSCW